MTSNHPVEKINSSTSWLKMQNSDHWPQDGKQIQCGMCSAKTNQEKI